MVKFNRQSLQILQQALSKHSGQKIFVKSYDILESSVESIYQTFDGKDLYPSIEEKASRLCFNIINNHPFVDGNKRIGILAMLCLLGINDVHLKCSNKDLISVGFSLANGKTNYNDLVYWVSAHKLNTATKDIENSK